MNKKLQDGDVRLQEKQWMQAWLHDDEGRLKDKQDMLQDKYGKLQDNEPVRMQDPTGLAR